MKKQIQEIKTMLQELSLDIKEELDFHHGYTTAISSIIKQLEQLEDNN